MGFPMGLGNPLPVPASYADDDGRSMQAKAEAFLGGTSGPLAIAPGSLPFDSRPAGPPTGTGAPVVMSAVGDVQPSHGPIGVPHLGSLPVTRKERDAVRSMGTEPQPTPRPALGGGAPGMSSLDANYKRVMGTYDNEKRLAASLDDARIAQHEAAAKGMRTEGALNAAAADKMQKMDAERDAALGKEMGLLRAEREEVRNAQVDPNRFFHDMKGGQAFTFLLTGLMSGIGDTLKARAGQQVNGGEAWMRQVNTQIDRDIAAQRDSIGNKKAALAEHDTAYNMLVAKYGKSRESTLQYEQMVLDSAKKVISAQVEETNSPIIKREGLLKINLIDRAQAERDGVYLEQKRREAIAAQAAATAAVQAALKSKREDQLADAKYYSDTGGKIRPGSDMPPDVGGGGPKLDASHVQIGLKNYVDGIEKDKINQTKTMLAIVDKIAPDPRDKVTDAQVAAFIAKNPGASPDQARDHLAPAEDQPGYWGNLGSSPVPNVIHDMALGGKNENPAREFEHAMLGLRIADKMRVTGMGAPAAEMAVIQETQVGGRTEAENRQFIRDQRETLARNEAMHASAAGPQVMEAYDRNMRSHLARKSSGEGK